MFSITSSLSPRPKLRVTCRSSTPFFPHEAQTSLEEIDRDDDEHAGRPDFDDGLSFVAGERDSADMHRESTYRTPVSCSNEWGQLYLADEASLFANSSRTLSTDLSPLKLTEATTSPVPKLTTVALKLVNAQ